jgi:hypothetical protein
VEVYDVQRWSACCKRCGAETFGLDEASAVERWNRRTPGRATDSVLAKIREAEKKSDRETAYVDRETTLAFLAEWTSSEGKSGAEWET